MEIIQLIHSGLIAFTCDMNHEYTAEQKAYNGGLVDKFVEMDIVKLVVK